jgi:hypothetical protein
LPCNPPLNRWLYLSGRTISHFKYTLCSSYRVIYKYNVVVDMTDVDLWCRRSNNGTGIHSQFWSLMIEKVKNSACSFSLYLPWVPFCDCCFLGQWLPISPYAYQCFLSAGCLTIFWCNTYLDICCQL